MNSRITAMIATTMRAKRNDNHSEVSRCLELTEETSMPIPVLVFHDKAPLVEMPERTQHNVEQTQKRSNVNSVLFLTVTQCIELEKQAAETNQIIKRFIAKQRIINVECASKMQRNANCIGMKKKTCIKHDMNRISVKGINSEKKKN